MLHNDLSAFIVTRNYLFGLNLRLFRMSPTEEKKSSRFSVLVVSSNHFLLGQGSVQLLFGNCERSLYGWVKNRSDYSSYRSFRTNKLSRLFYTTICVETTNAFTNVSKNSNVTVVAQHKSHTMFTSKHLPRTYTLVPRQHHLLRDILERTHRKQGISMMVVLNLRNQ